MIATGSRPSSDPGRQTAPPCTLVIFGAAGDLTKRLLVPSLYNLAEAHLLDEGFSVTGVDIADLDTAAWSASLAETLENFTHDSDAEFHPDHIDTAVWGWLTDRATYVRADFTADETFAALRRQLDGRSAIFYLAVAARFFAPIAERLGGAGLLAEPDGGGFRRLVIEKPFGHDLASARELNANLLAVASEPQIYRIDHFMGKESVQSLLAMRFGNRMFEPFWRAEHIERIEITAAETIGVEGRGRFYEPTGALRDMVPNHLFQLLCMTMMEAPSSLDPDDIRTARTRLLASVTPLKPGDVVFGQYGPGTIDGKPVPGYRDEPGVAADSQTETYVAARLAIRNWRWSGTPILLRTGKRLAARRTEIVVHLRPSPFALFSEVPLEHGTSERITLSIDPRQGIDIAFDVKRPGADMVLAQAVTAFSFSDAFDDSPNVGYEALLYDCMIGDATLFQRADTIAAAWTIVDPVLGAGRRRMLRTYPAGSDGPDASADRWALSPLAAQG